MKAALSVAIAIALVLVPRIGYSGTKKKVTHSDLTVSKKVDPASPKLYERTTTSAPHPTATPVKAAAKKTKISQGVLNGKAISKPQPAYPPIAK